MRYKVVVPNKAIALYKGFRVHIVGTFDNGRVLVHVYLERVRLLGRGMGRKEKVTEKPIICSDITSAFEAGLETARFEIDRLKPEIQHEG